MTPATAGEARLPAAPGAARSRHAAAPQRAHPRGPRAVFGAEAIARPERDGRARPGVPVRRHALPLRRDARDGHAISGPAHRPERRRLVGPVRARHVPGHTRGRRARARRRARRGRAGPTPAARRPRRRARVPRPPPAAPGRGLGDERRRGGGARRRGPLRRHRHRRPALRRRARPAPRGLRGGLLARAGGATGCSCWWTRCRTGT